jgi:hypothetical protein
MINNLFEIMKEAKENITLSIVDKKNIKKIDDTGFKLIIDNFFTQEELKELIKQINTLDWKQVGTNGYDSFESDIDKEYQGSKRVTALDVEISDKIWNKLKDIIPKTREYPEDCIDTDGHTTWTPIGVNPLLRFMKYEKGSLLVPHYDAPYKIDENTKTLSTIVIYLTTNTTGATRFIVESRDNHNYLDRNKLANDDEVVKKIKPEIGKLILFNHRDFHDSQLLEDDNNKIILRTDLIYKKII